MFVQSCFEPSSCWRSLIGREEILKFNCLFCWRCCRSAIIAATSLQFCVLLASPRRVECYTTTPPCIAQYGTRALLLTSTWSCTKKVASGIIILISHSRRHYDPPVTTLKLISSSPSCRDGHAVIVVTVSSWRSRCCRHHLDIAFQPSLSPSCCCCQYRILTSRFWRYVSLSHSSLLLLLSSWCDFWHCLSIVVECDLVVVVPSCAMVSPLLWARFMVS